MKPIYIIAGAAAALALLELRGNGFGGGTSNGAGAGSDFGGRPTTFGDGKWSPDEQTYCNEQTQLAAELRKMGAFQMFVHCANNPNDPRCLALKEVSACERELGTALKETEDGIIVGGALGAVKSVLGAALGGVLGDVLPIVVGAGIVYLLVTR